MSDYLRKRERERQLEKIRGKAPRQKRTPAAPKMAAPVKVARPRVRLHPYEESPTVGAAPPKMAARMKWDWVEGYAVISESPFEGPRVIGIIDIDRPKAKGQTARWSYARSSSRLMPVVDTLPDAVEGVLGPGALSDADRAAVEKLEAQVQAYYRRLLEAYA